MLDLLVFLQLMIMTSTKSNPSYGPPPPITELTLDQDLKLRQIELKLNSGNVNMKDVATLFIALQHQNFVMANCLKNLLEKWPKVPPTTNEVLPMFGILLESKD
tara:strand:- start:337 stop:648 length:312 start_codon:yes stop_codon:yes gene_type:complete